MKLVKSLSAIALIGFAVPAAHALTIKDDVVSVGVGVRLQTMAQISDATDTTGDEYRVQGGVADASNDPIDFYIQRARFSLKVKYGADWKGDITFMTDNVDRDGANSSRATNIRYAWIERGFKSGDMAHAINAGLQKPQQNPADARMSSSRLLFPNANAASGSTFLAVRGVGVGYRLEHPLFALFADVQNNAAAKDTSTAASRDEAEGFYYGMRAEFSFSPEWFTTKRSESYHGQEGTALVFGGSYSVNDGDVNAANTITTTAISADILIHYHAISAFIEYAIAEAETEPFAGTSSEVDSETMLIQIGYAFPLENGSVVEPALRYQTIDNNTDVDETVNFGNMAGTGASGDQIDIGVNYYMDGHGNKLQLAYGMWSAEKGDGDANIIRLMHQLNF